MKAGDLVRQTEKYLLSGKRSIGIVIDVNTGWNNKQVLVKWDVPSWFDKDGLSSEMPENLEVINETR